MLRGAGAMLALPHLEIMGAPTSSAGSRTTTGVPLRFLSMFIPNGVMPNQWDVSGVGSDYKLSPILQPLADLRDDFSVLSGLNNVSNGHVGLTASFLTGVRLKGTKNGESIDQRIARHIGQNTRFRSMVLGTEPPRQGKAGPPISVASSVSWSSATTRVSAEINPRVAFDRMFRTKSAAGADALKDAKYNKSVVDLVLRDAKSLHKKASYIDKGKLDEYLESVRAIEKQIDKTITPVQKSWTPPSKPNKRDLTRPDENIPIERDVHLRLMIDLIVLGLWTDTTRVCTLMSAHGFSRQNFSFLEGVKGDHHTISHHSGRQVKQDAYTKVSRWYVEQFVYLLKKLKGINEGNGSLLDNSIALFGSGMKDGNGHISKNLPILLAGKGQGKITQGKHYKLSSQPISNLHLTLAQKYGIEADDFNNLRGKTIGELS